MYADPYKVHSIVGRTRAEAEAKRDEYQQLVSVDGIQAHYAGSSGFDLSRYAPDEYLEYTDTDHGQTSARRYTTRRTVGQIVDSMGRLSDRNLFFVCGTPEDVVDKIQYWVEETDLDGFNVGQHLSPSSPATAERWRLPEPKMLSAVGIHRERIENHN